MGINNTVKKDGGDCLCISKESGGSGDCRHKKIGRGAVTFNYCRPRIESGYGSGDGCSFDNAFNGIDDIDWDYVDAGNIIYIYGEQISTNSIFSIRKNVNIEGVDCIIRSYYADADRTITLDLQGRENISIKNIEFGQFGWIGTGVEKNITVEGCKFLSGGSGYSYWCLRYGNDGWNFIGNEFANHSTGIYGSAFDAWEIGSANDVIIRGNTFHDMSEGDAHGIGIQACRGWLIEENEIYNTSSAILFYNQGDSVEMGNHIVRNNYIHDINDPLSSGNGIAVYDIAEVSPHEQLTYTFEGNIIDNTYGEGIVISTTTEKPFYIKNNVISNTGSHGIRFNLVSGDLIGEITGNTISNPNGEYIYPTGTFPNLLIENNVFE